jgi:tetratricopeptide (TPR) repeat protein
MRTEMRIPEGSLARNPLGIISLFVFFIEAIATVSLGVAIKTEYIGHVIWFIILFPTLIVILFFVTLWTKRECLYSPMEFRDDGSFLGLIDKVNKIETRQNAASMDIVTTEMGEVQKTVDQMLSFGDLYGAVEIGRAYLKQDRFDESSRVFEYLKEHGDHKGKAYSRVLSNLAYSYIGLGRYEEATEELLLAKKLRGSQFHAWHSTALAYCYFKLKDEKSYAKWLDAGKAMPEYGRSASFFKSLYPEISKDI